MKRVARLGLTALLAVLVLAGCGKRRSADVPPDARIGPTRLSLPTISVEEAERLFPKLDGAVPLKGPEKAKTGERVEAAYCYPDGEVPARAEEVRNALVTAGWPDVQVRPRPSAPNELVSLGARTPEFALRSSVQHTKIASCSADDGKVYVTVAVQKPHPGMDRGPGVRAPKRPFGPGGPAALRPPPRPDMPVLPPEPIAPPPAQ